MEERLSSEEVINKIVKLSKEIRDIYSQFDENGEYLSVVINVKDKYISINNDYWNKGLDKKVQVFLDGDMYV